jgi:hypothetical protein
MGADDPPPQTPAEVPAAVHRPAQLSHAAALVACEAASKKSAEIGVPMNIAIVDASLVSRLFSFVDVVYLVGPPNDKGFYSLDWISDQHGLQLANCMSLFA